MSHRHRFPPSPRPAASRGPRWLGGVALLGLALVFSAGLVQELRHAAQLDRDGRVAPAQLLHQQALPAKPAERQRWRLELAYEGHRAQLLVDGPVSDTGLWVHYDPARPDVADLYTYLPQGSALQYTERLRLILAWGFSGLLAGLLGLGLLRGSRPAASRMGMEAACVIPLLGSASV